LTFSTTAWSTVQTVTVDAGEDDDAVNDSVALTHTAGGGDYGAVSRNLTVTVTDIDTASTGITLAVTPAAVGESADATNVRVTGTLNHAPALTDTTVTVTVGATSDPATEGTDYGTVADLTLTIVAGATSGTASFTFTPVDDTVDETDETVTVGGTAAGVAVTAAALTIIDDDPGTPGSLTIDVEPSSVAEQAGSTPVTVTGTLSPPATQEVEVTVTVTGDTATEGADFAAVANFALTFAAGQASAAASFTLVPIADGVTERIETLKVVGTPSDVALSPIEAIVTITDGAPESDSEAPPTVSITGTGAVNEGQPVRFTVTRTGTATASLTVPVGVSEQGSFLAGAPAEEVRFAAGARSATLTVATADDETDEPDGSVTATLRAGSGYELGSASATVAVADNDDAPELSIADVRAVESAGMIEFTVHMAAASAFEVSVVCTSEDVTATANEDYEPELGTLVLAPGQTLGTIRVPIMDDMRDEMDETFMMLLSAPVNATLADDEATGTIVDDDESVAAAWLSRFGRTVASHVVDVVGSRLGPGPAPVSQAALAGRRLQSPPGPVPTDLLPVTWSEWEQPAEARRLDFAELLAGSAFDVVAATDGARNAPGGQWTAWGRGGVTHLAGADEHLAVEGQVAGALVGVEYDWGSILTGASAGYHDGRGRVEVAGANGLAPYTEEVESWLVSVHPYVSVEISDRVALWGLLGYGQGSMSLDGGGSSQETPITMTMGAVGGRGLLLSRAESERFRVALKADALLARMASDEAERLPAAMADAQRLRVVLEGSVDALRGPHGVLTPSLAVGARVDGGAAETGAGLEVGGGLSYAYPPWGLTVAADGRLLVAHEDRGFEQWGAGGSLRVAPGAQGVGPSLTLGTAWGDTTTQVEQLWSQGVGLAGGVDARNALGTSGSLAAELGYGLPAPASAVVTPFVGVALEESGSRTYRVGSRLNVGQSLRLALEAERHESGAAPSSKHVLKLTGTLIW
ncbi:MAG: hypothetical protein OXC12_17710, partial [Spirochaetaceae bacterium]|nr:hypothetical protein [Spirochaetaceae bacterium]